MDPPSVVVMGLCTFAFVDGDVVILVLHRNLYKRINEKMFLRLSFALAPLVHSSVMPEVKNTLALLNNLLAEGTELEWSGTWSFVAPLPSLRLCHMTFSVAAHF